MDYSTLGNIGGMGNVTTDNIGFSDSVNCFEPSTSHKLSKRSDTTKWAPITEKVETGRIEKGPESSQEIKTVDAEFVTIPFHTITYQMKPNSAKPTTNITEIRNYCTECGYRIRKSTWKFCPKCGETL
jgi:rubrerythrin